MFWAWTTLAAVTTFATFWAWTTLTLWTLHIVSRLLNEYTTRELVLTSLLVDINQLHVDFVTFLDASLFDSVETLPVDFADVKQTVLTRQELHEAAIRHHRTNGTVISLTNLRNGNDSLDLRHSSFDGSTVWSRNLHLAHTVLFIDGDDSLSVFLHLLNHLTARTDDSTDELLRNDDLLNAWYVWLQFWTRFRNRLHHLTHDVLTTSLCLHERLFENLIRKTVALDIHLSGSQTILRTCCLEVHVAEVVLIAKDIRKDSVLILTWVLDKTHGNTSHRVLDWHTCIHQCERTCTSGSHRRRAV